MGKRPRILRPDSRPERPRESEPALPGYRNSPTRSQTSHVRLVGPDHLANPGQRRTHLVGADVQIDVGVLVEVLESRIAVEIQTFGRDRSRDQAESGAARLEAVVADGDKVRVGRDIAVASFWDALEAKRRLSGKHKLLVPCVPNPSASGSTQVDPEADGEIVIVSEI